MNFPRNMLLTQMGLTFRDQVKSVADLPMAGELGDAYYVGNDQVYTWTENQTWVAVSNHSKPANNIFDTERHLLEFEGIQVLMRVPLHQPIYGDYSYKYPVHDSEPVSVLIERLNTTWPGIEMAVLDGRSGWLYCTTMTMGQLRNSYLMSRTPT